MNYLCNYLMIRYLYELDFIIYPSSKLTKCEYNKRNIIPTQIQEVSFGVKIQKNSLNGSDITAKKVCELEI